MKDKQITDKIEETLARANPVPAEELVTVARSAEASVLFDRIVGTRVYPDRDHATGTGIPRTRVRSRKAWLAAGVAVTAAAAVVIAVAVSARAPGQAHARPQAGTGTRLPAHLVDFSRQAGSIVVKITDPNAPVGQLNAIIKAHGLDIKINVIPVSPSLVGTIVYTDVSATRELRAGTCEMGGGGSCWIGFILPAGFNGSGNVTVGRAALPGQQYMSTDSVFTPGEALYGSGLVGKRASDALPVLRARHLGVLWRVDGMWTYSKTTPDGTIAHDSMAWNSTTVVLDVSGPATQAGRIPLTPAERKEIMGQNKAGQKMILDKLQKSILLQHIAH